MEHRAPRLPEPALEFYNTDSLPYHKGDILRAALLFCKMSEEEIERQLMEILPKVLMLTDLVDTLVARHRELARLIRLHKKKGTPEDALLVQEYEGQRWSVLMDAAALSARIPHIRFGRFFPMTHRQLARRITWLITPKKQPEEAPNTENGQTLSCPPAASDRFDIKSHDCISYSTQLPGIMDFSGDILKMLSAKYLQNYNPN
jgi:hypothetical protein